MHGREFSPSLPAGRVFINTNRSLRGQVIDVFDSTFAITYALEAIAIFVSMFGAAATLLTLALERRQDIAMLRLVGAERHHLRRMIMVEAGLIGVVSLAIGVVVGFLLSLILIFVIQRTELRLDHSVSRPGVVSPAGVPADPGGDRGGRPLSGAAGFHLHDGRPEGGVMTARWWRPTALLWMPILLLVCGSARVMVRQSGELWRQARPGRLLAFPTDHASHPDYRIEWWYYTGNLEATDGRPFGYQVTFFRVGVDREPENPSPWAVRDLFMTHVAVTDIDGGQHHFDERLNRAGVGVGGCAHRPARGVERGLATQIGRRRPPYQCGKP